MLIKVIIKTSISPNEIKAEDGKDFRSVENYMGSKVINHIYNKS